MTSRCSALAADRRITRLTVSDLSNLRYETQAAPMHIGALVVVEAGEFLDAAGRLRLDELRRRIELRLPRVPVLRRRLFSPGLFQGRPVWVDEEAFDIAHHVREVVLSPPAPDAELLEAAERLMGVLLDRARPLWELWFITGLSGERIGILVKLHHAIADGRAAVAMMSSLFDPSPEDPDPAPCQWSPEPAPGSWALFADNLSARVNAVRRGARLLAHPSRTAASAWAIGRVLLRGLRGTAAPQSSINRQVAPGRRVRFERFELAALKEIAQAAGGKVTEAARAVALWNLWAYRRAADEGFARRTRSSPASAKRRLQSPRDRTRFRVATGLRSHSSPAPLGAASVTQRSPGASRQATGLRSARDPRVAGTLAEHRDARGGSRAGLERVLPGVLGSRWCQPRLGADRRLGPKHRPDLRDSGG